MPQKVVEMFKPQHSLATYLDEASASARRQRLFGELETRVLSLPPGGNDILANAVQQGFFGDVIAADFVKWIRARISSTMDHDESVATESCYLEEVNQ